MSVFRTNPSRFWSYTPPTSGGIASTSPVTIYAPSPGDRPYVTDIQLQSYCGSGSVIAQITNAGNLLWQFQIGAFCPGLAHRFETPLRATTPGSGIVFQILSTPFSPVFVNVQGFIDNTTS